MTGKFSVLYLILICVLGGEGSQAVHHVYLLKEQRQLEHLLPSLHVADRGIPYLVRV
jgi:hypothetical protein